MVGTFGAMGDAFFGEHRQRSYAAFLDVRQRQRYDFKIHQIGHEDRSAPAAGACSRQFYPGNLEQFLGGQIDRRAGAGIAEIELAGLVRARSTNSLSVLAGMVGLTTATL
jgi:hypothetical protein